MVHDFVLSVVVMISPQWVEATLEDKALAHVVKQNESQSRSVEVTINGTPEGLIVAYGGLVTGHGTSPPAA